MAKSAKPAAAIQPTTQTTTHATTRATTQPTTRTTTQATTRAAGVVGEFFAGFATLFRGFSWWKHRTGLMLFGLIPALIVAVALIALIIVIANSAEAIVTFVTPFADSWDPGWARFFRVVVAISLLIGFVILAAATYTALTLVVGDWFYERIWRAVEADLGGMPPEHETGFWRAVLDGLRLVTRAVVTSVLLALLSFIPVIGTILALVLGLVFTARIIAIELTTRPFEARGMRRGERLAVLRTNSPRVFGFGLAVYLCFLIPGGAILVMSAAVAGATHLARDLLERGSTAPA